MDDKALGRSLRKDKVGIAFGGFASNLGAAFLMTYLTYYLTDSMLISAAAASLILLISRLLDGILDLWMGTMIDRCRNKRGKARPFLLWMALPTIASLALLFYVPAHWSNAGRIGYSFVTYIICAFFTLTAVYLPVQALTPLITTNPRQRQIVSQILGFFVTIGAVLLNFFSQPIMLAFGSQTLDDGSVVVSQWGYFWFAILIGVVCAITLVVCYFLVKERTIEELEATQQERPKFWKGIGKVAKNKYWWLALILWMCIQLVPACWGATPYYTIYFTGGRVDMGQLMALLWGGITIGILIFVPVTRRTGKRTSSIIGIAMQAVGGIMLWFAPYSIGMCWISTVFRSVGVGALIGNEGAMIADLCEYSEWKYGIRNEGLVISSTSIGNKLGLAFGGAIVAGFLALGGYVANAPTQTASAMTSIKVSFIAFPFVADILIIVFLLIFGRIEKMMPKITHDLDERHHAHHETVPQQT